MDKYEFNIKVEQIRKMVNKGDYETAIKIADAIDWRRVHNANLLSMASQVYEKNKEYGYAKDILLMAYERAPVGKRLLYKLTELAIKEGNDEEAEGYYRDFSQIAGDDPRQYLLRYMLLKKRNAPTEQLINCLESYTEEELDEKWMYELAELYHEAGEGDKCVAVCDKLMLMFGLGRYVEKAMDLKLQYAPLSKYQMDLVENRDKYEEKMRATSEYYDGEDAPAEEYAGEEWKPQPPEKKQPAADLVVEGAPEPVEELSEQEEAPEESAPLVSYEKESVEADLRQAEAEKHLAKEMSRMEPGAPEEGSDELGKTRIVKELKRTRPAVSRETEPPKSEEKEQPKTKEPDTDPPKAAPRKEVRPRHVMVEARTPEKGMETAVQTLKQIRKETGIKNPVIKITGSRLSKRGVLASAEKLAGKDLMIEEAGDLTEEAVGELELLISRDHTGMRIILIDNPKQMQILKSKSPTLSDWFDYVRGDAPIEEGTPENRIPKKPAVPEDVPREDDRPVRKVVPVKDTAMRVPDEPYPEPEPEADPEEEMDIDEFAQYACQYAEDIDCSITGKSMLALYERIEIMEEDGIRLTRANAEDLIEEAADRAEKPSLGKRIKGIFSSKYDKDGRLILKEEHFIG